MTPDKPLREAWNTWLVLRHEERNNPDADRARSYLIEYYKPLVERVLRRVGRSARPQDREDLRGSGYVGLIKAVDEWDPYRMRWEPFAQFKISYAMVDHIRGMTWVPKALRARATGIEAEEERLFVELGREPTVAELAERLGIDEERLEAQIGSFRTTAWSVASLDHRQTEETPWTEMVPDVNAEDPEDALFRHEDIDRFELVLQRLPGRYREIIRWRYFSVPRVSQKEIAERLQVHESRVSQILAAAVAKARELADQPCLLPELFNADKRFTVRD